MIGTYRYGEPRADFSLRIGAARQPPRGVRHQDYRKKNYFDLWLRVLSPSPELLSRYRKNDITFSQFKSRYRKEMSRLEQRQAIDLLALLSRIQPVSVGCFCECADKCHRSILKRLIESADSKIPPSQPAERRPNASPVCYLEEEEN